MRKAAAIAVLAAAALLAGCAVPLGPGYRIRKQEAQLGYAAGEERAQVRVWYEVENAGNAALEELALAVPVAAVASDAGLRLTAGGQTRTLRLPAAGATGGDGGVAVVTAEFDPPWPQERRLEIVVEYSLPAAGAKAGEAFQFTAEDWFPALVPPEKIFARGQWRHHKTRIRIRLPAGWSVISSGRARGTRRRDAAVEHRFELREDDFPPFIVAGRYQAQAVTAHGQTVVFWTKRPLDAALAEQAGARLAQTVNFFEASFGPRTSKGHQSVWVIEQPLLADMPPPHAASLDRQTPAPDNPELLASLERELVWTWFQHVARPEGKWEGSLLVALADFAAQRAAETRGTGTARPESLARAIESYDALDRQRELSSSVAAEKIMRDHKAALFLAALEDRVGREHLLAALKRMVQARRNDTWNVNDLRSALEYESGQDLAAMFRQWLYEPGTPAEFREKYGRKQP